MRRGPLAASLSVLIAVGAACGTHGNEHLSSTTSTLSEKSTDPSQVDVNQLLADLALKEHEFEAQIKDGHVKQTVNMGKCAMLGSKSDPDKRVHIVIDPAVLSAKEPGSDVSISEDVGYDASNSRIFYGPPVLVRTENGQTSVRGLPSDSLEYVIQRFDHSEVAIDATSNKLGNFKDNDSGFSVFSITAEAVPGPNRTIEDLSRSNVAIVACAEALLPGNLAANDV